MLYASSFSLSRTTRQSAFYKVLSSSLSLQKYTPSPPRAPPHYFSSVTLDTETVPITCQQKHVEHRRLESSVIDLSPHVFSSHDEFFVFFFGGTFNSAAKNKSFTSSRVHTHRCGPAARLSIKAKVKKNRRPSHD